MASVRWLQRRKAVERQARAVELLCWAIVALLLLGGLALVAWIRSEFGGHASPEVREAVRLLQLLLLLGGLALPLLLLMILPVTRAMRTRVGVDGERVLLRPGDGRSLDVAAADLRHGRCCLHHRQFTVPLRDRRGRSFYAEGELENRLEPLLSPANALSQWEALKHQWTWRDPVLLWPLAASAALLALLALVLGLLYAHPGVFGG